MFPKLSNTQDEPAQSIFRSVTTRRQTEEICVPADTLLQQRRCELCATCTISCVPIPYKTTSRVAFVISVVVQTVNEKKYVLTYVLTWSSVTAFAITYSAQPCGSPRTKNTFLSGQELHYFLYIHKFIHMYCGGSGN